MTETPEARVYDAEIVVGDGGVAVLIPEAGFSPAFWQMADGRLDIVDQDGTIIAASPVPETGMVILEKASTLQCVSVDNDGPYRPFTLSFRRPSSA